MSENADEPRLTATSGPSTRVAVPEGRLNHTNAPRFEELLREQCAQAMAERKHVVIDLSRVEYLSSIILKAIRSQKEELRRQDLNLAICCPNRAVREILKIAQFHFVARVYDSRPQAEAAVAGETGQAD